MIDLDPARVADAAERAREHLRAAFLLEQRAKAARAKAFQLQRTWGLGPGDLELSPEDLVSNDTSAFPPGGEFEKGLTTQN